MNDGELIEAPKSLNGVVGLGDAEVHFVEVPLGEGAEGNLRKKFALSAQRKAIRHLATSLSDGTLNRGDLSRGEIHLTAVRRIYTHHFWSELQMGVEMPSHDGGTPKKAAFAGVIPAHKFFPGASALPVIDRDTIVLIKRYSFHSCYSETIPGHGKGWRIEAPRGGAKPDESLADCALREASEEAGIKAGPDISVTRVGTTEPDSGILMASLGLFVIEGIEVDRKIVHLDVTESPTDTIVISVDTALDRL